MDKPSPLFDDLLQPTLTEEDDAVGFDHPWRPWTLIIVTFFGGLIAGGGLLAYNFSRLGMEEKKNSALILVGVGECLIYVALYTLIGQGWIPADSVEARQGTRMGIRLFSCGIALYLASQQKKRYRLFEASGLESGKLLKPALLALLASVVIDGVLIMLLTDLLV